ncbi:hypothetical protein LOTGIDRAFT_234533 [Lottia gigantea]|uniref:COMM domain-containing protein n=1 Tax=Lottia gigantea TaxID=225164 RepID=V3ZBS8_LOTGI|nr:hypothetical protein LOTGIDRAFT_234533 [Lottia gigantea]ESO88483.1 hypothetical protein LOTGIDRAFT_234533 [Lottia gigantea]
MSDMQEIKDLLKKINANDLSKLTHQIVSRLCTKKSLNFQSYCQIWSLEEWWIVTNFIEEHVIKAVKNKLTKDEVLKLFETTGISDEYSQCLVEVVTARNQETQQYLKLKTSQISHNVLTDFDWQMKLVMSSDKYSSIHQPLLNLDLQTVTSNNDNQTVSLELNKEDLKKLISSLDGASKAVQQLTT